MENFTLEDLKNGRFLPKPKSHQIHSICSVRSGILKHLEEQLPKCLSKEDEQTKLQNDGLYKV